ncbi:hypothetical protein Halru_1717 [Halovivax ruber XH-70]|uniref:Uncharacterized protein n=2 Tax=Halovivax ruber TaxID=387341 RepID=L0IBZ6_HALRX|nr:hypothetical protein Halru_1717 [Halovivax ruber XH-70]
MLDVGVSDEFEQIEGIVESRPPQPIARYIHRTVSTEVGVIELV